MTILLLFLAFFLLMFLGVPLFAVMGLAPLVPKIFNPTLNYNMMAMIRWGVGGADSTPIIAIPMFILAGVIMSRGGISKKLFDVFAYFIGKRKAGLPCAAIITALFYGAISGSGVATAAAVGSMTIPLLMELGYDGKFCAAMVATAGGLGVIIPPSIPFVFYGMMTGESVGNMFTAGILPGILIAVSLMAYAYIYCSKKGEDKEKIHAMVDSLRSKGLLLVLKESFWAIMSPVIILGGIYSGIVTPTEAATVSVFYSIFVSVFIYKTVEKNEVGKLLRESIAQYAPMILILALAMAFARTLTILKAPIIIGEFVSVKLGSKILFLLAVNLLMFILGMFMDTGPAVVILAPILAPVGAMLGVDPIHLGVIMVANLAVGMVTPPFGLNLFISAPLANEPVSAVSKAALPFIFTFMIALMIITFVPDVSMLLVNMMK